VYNLEMHEIDAHCMTSLTKMTKHI